MTFFVKPVEKLRKVSVQKLQKCRKYL